VVIRATYELEPASWAEELARVEAGEVVSVEGGRAVVEFSPRNWGRDVALLVSSILAGEWADSAALERCRLVGLEWPEGLPGPAFEAPEEVLVGAIVKPPLGLDPREFAETAAALARGGADLIKDDELLGDQAWCPLEERVRAVVAAIPEHVRYAANVTGPVDGLLRRAERAVELGASALMVNAFAQGVDALRALREAELGVPLFAHRVGAALWIRGPLGVAGTVVVELTRLCGADYVQVGSFSGRVFEDKNQCGRRWPRATGRSVARGPRRPCSAAASGPRTRRSTSAAPAPIRACSCCSARARTRTRAASRRACAPPSRR
jgi:Ribulose bisphosphate carboxylase large chain, catalytic domain